jgi:hypothetical protein
MTLELKKFDMRAITFDPKENKGPVIVLIGRRDTGKTFLVKDLLYHHQDIPIGTVISGTEAGNGFYGKLVPKLFIHEEYNSILIENVLRRQKTVMKQCQSEMETYKKCSIDPRTFVILDDCLYDSSWTKDKLMRSKVCKEFSLDKKISFVEGCDSFHKSTLKFHLKSNEPRQTQ